MNKKIQRLVEPNIRLYLFFMVAFAAASLLFEQYILAAVEGGIILFLVVCSLFVSRRKRRELMEYIESVTYDADTAKNNTLLNFPLPMAVFSLNDSRVIWANQIFFNMCGVSGSRFEARLDELVPTFSGKWLLEGKTQYPGLLAMGGRKYQIHGNIIRPAEESAEPGHGYMGIAYWVDVTEYDDIRIKYEETRPVIATIVIDNYDELVKNHPDRIKNDLRDAVEDSISQWCDGKDGFLRRYDRDRYVFIFEERWLAAMKAEKFALLEQVHSVVSPSGIHATISIGVGHDGSGFEEDFQFSSLAAEMALSRGGDQAVVKNRFNFEFFGGRGSEVETRTKVKSRVMANALAELIADSSRVFVMGHKFADLDAVGSSVAVCCIARKKGKLCRIVIDPVKNSSQLLIDRMKNEPEYKNAFITPQEAMLSGIVLDTKNFTIRTGERTFDAAAFLRRAGADTTEVKKLLQNDMEHTVARYKILQSAQLYRGNIAVAVPQTPQDRVVVAQAADELLNISGVEVSFVVCPTEDGANISARSIGDMNAQMIMEKLGGGGNRSAAAAQLHDTTLRDAVNSLFAAIDEYLDG